MSEEESDNLLSNMESNKKETFTIQKPINEIVCNVLRIVACVIWRISIVIVIIFFSLLRGDLSNKQFHHHVTNVEQVTILKYDIDHCSDGMARVIAISDNNNLYFNTCNLDTNCLDTATILTDYPLNSFHDVYFTGFELGCVTVNKYDTLLHNFHIHECIFILSIIYFTICSILINYKYIEDIS